MSKKQTAVEWLIEQMKKPYADKHIMDILDQAKAMEKMEIEEAFKHGTLPTFLQETLTAEQYYTETYEQ